MKNQEQSNLTALREIKIIHGSHKEFPLKKKYRNLEKVPENEVHRLSTKNQELWYQIKTNRDRFELLSNMSSIAYSSALTSKNTDESKEYILDDSPLHWYKKPIGKWREKILKNILN